MNHRRLSKNVSLLTCLLTILSVLFQSIVSLNVVASEKFSSARGGAVTRASATRSSTSTNEPAVAQESGGSDIFDAGEMVVDDPSTVRSACILVLGERDSAMVDTGFICTLRFVTNNSSFCSSSFCGCTIRTVVLSKSCFSRPTRVAVIARRPNHSPTNCSCTIREAPMICWTCGHKMDAGLTEPWWKPTNI